MRTKPYQIQNNHEIQIAGKNVFKRIKLMKKLMIVMETDHLFPEIEGRGSV